MLNAAKQWYADIAELRQKYTLMMLIAVIRENARENTSKAIKEFFIEKGVGNYFSTPYEPWQNMAESSIKSIMLLAKLRWLSLVWQADSGTVQQTSVARAGMLLSSSDWEQLCMPRFSESRSMCQNFDPSDARPTCTFEQGTT